MDEASVYRITLTIMQSYEFYPK